MIKIKNLCKNFGGIKAVNNCSFDVSEKSITALIGPNGSGKSTIFNLISGIIKADSGEIKFDKKDITNKSIEYISNIGVSRVFQKSRLFDNLTVLDNLLLAFDNKDTKFWNNFFRLLKNKKKEGIVENFLALVKLEKMKNKKAGDLSFGQKRMVELIRAIINPHKLLVLDEPVAGVNPALRKVIRKILFDLKTKGETILIIEHDMNFIFDIADQIVVMDEGRVIAQGNPKFIRSNKNVQEAYFG